MYQTQVSDTADNEIQMKFPTKQFGYWRLIKKPSKKYVCGEYCYEGRFRPAQFLTDIYSTVVKLST